MDLDQRVSNCGTINGYHRHKREKSEICDSCRDAQRIWWRNRRVTHNAHINALRKAWRERTPNARRDRMKRAKKNGGELGYYSDQDVIDTYGTKCHICGDEIDFTAERQCGRLGWEKGFHVDHVIPLSKGGADTIENVRPSHGQCNIIKWATIKEQKHDT